MIAHPLPPFLLIFFPHHSPGEEVHERAGGESQRGQDGRHRQPQGGVRGALQDSRPGNQEVNMESSLRSCRVGQAKWRKQCCGAEIILFCLRL